MAGNMSNMPPMQSPTATRRAEDTLGRQGTMGTMIGQGQDIIRNLRDAFRANPHGGPYSNRDMESRDMRTLALGLGGATGAGFAPPGVQQALTQQYLAADMQRLAQLFEELRAKMIEQNKMLNWALQHAPPARLIDRGDGNLHAPWDLPNTNTAPASDPD